MIEVNGKGGISVRLLAYSQCRDSEISLATFEAVYPRIIHCELLTHGMLSFNSASSRATPFEKMAQNLNGAPVRFGKNQAGMQDQGESFAQELEADWLKVAIGPEEAWREAKREALQWSKLFYETGYHKQVYNRLTEPFQMMKTLITATEFANFFWLRNHDAADPTLQELAKVMHEALEQATPQVLLPGEWHLPYVETEVDASGELEYFIEAEHGTEPQYLTLEEAKIVSGARCAAVSFRNTDYTLEKSKQVYARLLGDDRKHGSAFQHQGTPMDYSSYRKSTNVSTDPHTWQRGISHSDRQHQLWSGQFRGWVQLRKLIAGENVPGFIPPT